MVKDENWIRREFVKALIQAIVVLIVGGMSSVILSALTPSAWKAVKDLALLRVAIPLVALALVLVLLIIAILFITRSMQKLRAELASDRESSIQQPVRKRNEVQLAVLNYLAVQQYAVRDDTIATQVAASPEGQAKHWTQPQVEAALAALAALEEGRFVRWNLRDYRRCFQLTQKGFDAIEPA